MSQTGIITHFHFKKGFGFIEATSGESLYFKRKELLGAFEESLLVGQEVTFMLGRNHGGKTATKISFIQQSAPAPKKKTKKKPAKTLSALAATGVGKVEEVQKMLKTEEVDVAPVVSKKAVKVEGMKVIKAQFIEPQKIEIAKVRIANLALITTYKVKVGTAKAGLFAVRAMDAVAAYIEVKASKLHSTKIPTLLEPKLLENKSE
jgi:cold shock CspA family protein